MKTILFALLALCSTLAQAALSVVDDSGKQVVLARPAQRVISMAPHVTELLFAAGGGARIIGAMNYSDYPLEARKIPLIGSDSQIDLERVIALKPDLLIVWQSGNTARQIAQLASLGIPVFYSEPHSFETVESSLLRFGRLLGTEPTAAAAAAQFRAKVNGLRTRYASRPPVTVFYQAWDNPLFTLNGEQIASDAIRLCGGRNIFGDLKTIAPQVSLEAVVQADPEAIVGGKLYTPQDRGLSIWQPYRGMTAVRRNNLFTLDEEMITRPGPRVVDGAAVLCTRLEEARARR
ncbi:cobalamin-binding protein [Massilia litorea]|jgi:iron complex transport system substrate-binding protein|uniref:Cobalamin-binding protein n=1 Tax=Massilia litorea TaxID=2769491 RepID=A0A7L9U3Y3_9BURK|nr:cobalamin-binding protein [Massilia litorea]QOL49590.1 cobalamin-binding protein [Massilia litorea]